MQQAVGVKHVIQAGRTWLCTTCAAPGTDGATIGRLVAVYHPGNQEVRDIATVCALCCVCIGRIQDAAKAEDR